MPYADPEKRKARLRWRYQNDPEFRAKKRAYYHENREEIIAKVQARTDPVAKHEYDQRHNQKPEVRAKRAKQRKAWNEANADLTRAHNRARSHVRRGARPDAEAKEYMAIILHDPCAYCGDAAEHVDHIVPLKSGGDSMWDNLTPACQRCNYAKRDKSLLSFLAA